MVEQMVVLKAVSLENKTVVCLVACLVDSTASYWVEKSVVSLVNFSVDLKVWKKDELKDNWSVALLVLQKVVKWEL
jgi:isoprenylcysteine carboxyl methyltransferase (ICMT) family protein YpbQ